MAGNSGGPWGGGSDGPKRPSNGSDGSRPPKNNNQGQMPPEIDDMLKKGHRRRPVLDHGRLVGQITCRQLLRVVSEFNQNQVAAH